MAWGPAIQRGWLSLSWGPRQTLQRKPVEHRIPVGQRPLHPPVGTIVMLGLAVALLWPVEYRWK